MPRTRGKTRIQLWLALFLVLPISSLSYAWYVISDLPERIQEHSNWCWDASSQSILYYYQNYPTQCEIANWAWGRNDCCGNPVFYWDHPCNLPNSICVIRDIIDNYRDIYSDCLGDYLSESVVNYEADAHRPFGIRFGWKGGGGHILVGRGYSDGYVYYMDPWPGNGYTISTYAWVVDSPKHSWTHTVRVKNPGKPDLVAPSGTVTDHTPSYTWKGVTDATWYRLYVRNSAGAVVFDDWLSQSEHFCLDGICWYTPTASLGNATYTWWVQPTLYYSGAWRYGPWSKSKKFTLIGG